MSEPNDLPPVGSHVRWAKCGRGTCLPKEIIAYRDFPGINPRTSRTYALLSWTSYGQKFGTPQCEWVKASYIRDLYEEVKL